MAITKCALFALLICAAVSSARTSLQDIDRDYDAVLTEDLITRLTNALKRRSARDMSIVAGIGSASGDVVNGGVAVEAGSSASVGWRGADATGYGEVGGEGDLVSGEASGSAFSFGRGSGIGGQGSVGAGATNGGIMIGGGGSVSTGRGGATAEGSAGGMISGSSGSVSAGSRSGSITGIGGGRRPRDVSIVGGIGSASGDVVNGGVAVEAGSSASVGWTGAGATGYGEVGGEGDLVSGEASGSAFRFGGGSGIGGQGSVVAGATNGGIMIGGGGSVSTGRGGATAEGSAGGMISGSSGSVSAGSRSGSITGIGGGRRPRRRRGSFSS